MEVGYQGIYRLELIAGIDEDRGLAVYGVHLAVGSAYALQNSARGSADRYNSATLGAALIDLACHLVGDVEIFAVHKMLFNFINLNRSERAKAYVQSNLSVADALGLDSLEELIRKVKSRSGSGSRALLLSVYGLVVALVLELLGYVGGQGHIAYCVKNLIHGLVFIGIVIESYHTVATVNNVGNSRLEYATKVEAGANLCSLAGTDERFPLTAIEHSEEQKLHRSACLFGSAKESCGDYLRGVNHKHILRVKVVDYVTEYLVLDLALCSVEHHKAAHISLG